MNEPNIFSKIAPKIEQQHLYDSAFGKYTTTRGVIDER